ncbi:MAG: hypothetical protein AB7N71_04450, partial [Phycisphaerae bacterium]
LITRNLAKRLGDGAVQAIQSLEKLYPKKEPYFLKDLLVKKTVPEQGLVYRNQDQLARNRRLHRMLWASSAVLGVASIFGLWWATGAIKKAVKDPTERAITSRNHNELDAKKALNIAGMIEDDVAGFEKVRWATNLLTFGTGNPGADMLTIRNGLVRWRILPTLGDQLEKAFRAQAASSSTKPPADEALAVAATVAKWLVNSEKPIGTPSCITESDFHTMAAFAPSPGGEGNFGAWTVPGLRKLGKEAGGQSGKVAAAEVDTKPQAAAESADGIPVSHVVAAYFASLDRDDDANAASAFRENGDALFRAALEHLSSHFGPYAKLEVTDDDALDEDLGNLLTIARAAGKVDQSYKSVLSLDSPQENDAADSTTVDFNTFIARKKQFDEELGALERRLSIVDAEDADRLWALLGDYRAARWAQVDKQITSALAECPGSEARRNDILAAVDRAASALDQDFWAALSALGLTKDPAFPQLPPDEAGRYVSIFSVEGGIAANFADLSEGYPHLLQKNDRRLAIKSDALAVQSVLAEYAKFGNAAAGGSFDLAGWVDVLAQHGQMNPSDMLAQLDQNESLLKGVKHDRWKRTVLREIGSDFVGESHRRQGTAYLAALESALSPLEDSNSGWGIAALVRNHDDLRQSSFFIPLGSPTQSATSIPFMATNDCLIATSKLARDLTEQAGRVSTNEHSLAAGRPAQLEAKIAAAWRAYTQRYMQEWKSAAAKFAVEMPANQWRDAVATVKSNEIRAKLLNGISDLSKNVIFAGLAFAGTQIVEDIPSVAMRTDVNQAFQNAFQTSRPLPQHYAATMAGGLNPLEGAFKEAWGRLARDVDDADAVLHKGRDSATLDSLFEQVRAIEPQIGPIKLAADLERSLCELLAAQCAAKLGNTISANMSCEAILDLCDGNKLRESESLLNLIRKCAGTAGTDMRFDLINELCGLLQQRNRLDSIRVRIVGNPFGDSKIDYGAQHFFQTAIVSCGGQQVEYVKDGEYAVRGDWEIPATLRDLPSLKIEFRGLKPGAGFKQQVPTIYPFEGKPFRVELASRGISNAPTEFRFSGTDSTGVKRHMVFGYQVELTGDASLLQQIDAKLRALGCQ